MNTVLERDTAVLTEEERHNAMISERYRKLFDAVENQHGTDTLSLEHDYASTYTMERPSYAPIAEMPILEQVPAVTTYEPSQVAKSVFTTEKLERMAERVETLTPVHNVSAAAQVIAKPVVSTAASYSLNAMAKMALVAFTGVVVIMLALIGANTQTIQRKTLRLKNLEEKKQELVEKNEEIQRRIQELQSEENIIERATEAGILN